MPGPKFVEDGLFSVMPAQRLLSFATVWILISTMFFCVPTPGGASGPSPMSVWSVATTLSPSGTWGAVDFLNNQWIALGQTAEVAVSTNASTWTEYSAPLGSWQSLAYGNGQYVALSSVISGQEEMVSANGTYWTAIPGPPGEWTGLVFAQGRFVAVGRLGEISTSTNGEQWTQVWHHPRWSLTSIAYGNGHFVAVDSAAGSTLISRNGVDWSLRPSLGSGLKWSSVVFGNGTFVAFDGSGSGYVATSVDGYAWALHRYSTGEEITAATFGCGSFLASGNSEGTSNFLSSSTGASWTTVAAPTGISADWTAVAYGGNKFIAADTSGEISWTNSAADCAAAIPSTPQQVSGNVASGQIWTYMHPSAQSGGSKVNAYRVTVSNGTITKVCTAPVYFQPNCIIKGLADGEVYWVTAQARNRFGYSAYTDPIVAIPVARWSLSAVAAKPVVAQSQPVIIKVTGVIANAQGVYPTSVVTIHFGSMIAYCHPNPFGECLVTFSNPPVGLTSIYASYTGYGTSYVSPTSHVTISP